MWIMTRCGTSGGGSSISQGSLVVLAEHPRQVVWSVRRHARGAALCSILKIKPHPQPLSVGVISQLVWDSQQRFLSLARVVWEWFWI
jgi:hypothetical protein